MALKTLEHVTDIDGYHVARVRINAFTGVVVDNARPAIAIDDDNNIIAFKIQDGPIKEVGINGCQVDTLLHAALRIIVGLNEIFPCDSNKMAISNIEEALAHLNERTRDRIKRGVEGTSNK